MPLLYKPAAEGKDVKPAQIPSPGNNSFLEDTFTSDAPKDKQISCGFYRQEKGEPLVYTYDYDEMKIIVEVSGEFTLTDETGKKLVPNQVMFFTLAKVQPSLLNPPITL